jgi:DNA repair protein RecN (Recombination protein N)
MLKRLYLENFALVEKLDIAFQPGMNVLTGETGAGKSIIVGALARLLGEKAGRDDIRSGTESAVIEGDFNIGGSKEIINQLINIHIDFDNDPLVIRREIYSDRASKAFINNQPVNLNQLRNVTGYLAELFGQHSHQQLLDEKNHLTFLDQFAGLEKTAEKAKTLFAGWNETTTELKNLIARKESARKEHELLLFQKDEIEKARIRSGEEKELLAEKKILDSAQILGEKSSRILSLLDSDEYSILNKLTEGQKELGEMVRLDGSLNGYDELMNNAIINLEELRSEIEGYQSRIPHDANRLEEINYRLDEIYRLRKKYGGSEEAVLTTLKQINTRLESKPEIGLQIKELTSKENEFRRRYGETAVALANKRKTAAGKLSATVTGELMKLGIDSARFECEFEYEDDDNGIEHLQRKVKPLPTGLETIRFMISANPGEPLKPLVKTASGGEISRVMLALRSANRTPCRGTRPVLVFDEIDAGIGGQTAMKVADRIAALAENYQLVVITHLHQIAVKGDNHLAVEKIDSRSDVRRKVISARALSKTDRKNEIKRMIAIAPETKLTKKT